MSSIATRLISDLQVGALSLQSWSQLGATMFVCPASKKLLCVHTGVHTACSWAPDLRYHLFKLRTGSSGRVTTLRLSREMIWVRATKIPGGQGFSRRSSYSRTSVRVPCMIRHNLEQIPSIAVSNFTGYKLTYPLSNSFFGRIMESDSAGETRT